MSELVVSFYVLAIIILGIVLAAVESQKSAGPKQFERANYYTGKTVTFNPKDFSNLVASRGSIN